MTSRQLDTPNLLHENVMTKRIKKWKTRFYISENC